MVVRRAHVDSALLQGLAPPCDVALPVDVAHRFARVLRLPEGAPIELFCDAGFVCRGHFSPPTTLRAGEVTTVGDGLPPLVVAQALAKSDKLEWVVQKATELGASAIVLYAARRSVVRLDEERGDKKVQRLSRVAADACRQSGRAAPPRIEGPVPFAALCERVRFGAAICVVGAVDADTPLLQTLQARIDVLRANGMMVIVGPEGGLDGAELEALATAGAVPVRLGAFVLRTETAAVTALSVAQAALGLA